MPQTIVELANVVNGHLDRVEWIRVRVAEIDAKLAALDGANAAPPPWTLDRPLQQTSQNRQAHAKRLISELRAERDGLVAERDERTQNFWKGI